jgi:hypothetical protein
VCHFVDVVFHPWVLEQSLQHIFFLAQVWLRPPISYSSPVPVLAELALKEAPISQHLPVPPPGPYPELLPACRV